MNMPLMVAVCAITSLALRRRPEACVAIALALLLFVPVSVQETIFPGVHPGVILMITFLPAYLTVKESGMKSNEVYGGYAVMLSVVALMFTSSHGEYLGWIKLALNLIVAPGSLAMVLVGMSRTKQNVHRNIQYLLISLVVVNVAVACLQHYFGGQLIFRSINAEYYDWGVESTSRRAGWMGTPLDLAFVCAAIAPTVLLIKSSAFRFFVAAATVCGCVLAQARVALVVVAILLIMIAILQALRSAVAAFGTLVVLTIAVVSAYFSGGLDFVIARFQDGWVDPYRMQAYEWFLQNIVSFAFTGAGPYADPRLLGLTTSSLENAYFVYAYRFGVVFSLALLSFHMWISAKSLSNGQLSSFWGVLIMTLLSMTNSSFGGSPQLAIVFVAVGCGAMLKNPTSISGAETTYSGQQLLLQEAKVLFSRNNKIR